jgi:hypothetical protein
MPIKHLSESCGELLAAHDHANYQEVKDCRATMRAAINAQVGQDARFPRMGRAPEDRGHSSEEPIQVPQTP